MVLAADVGLSAFTQICQLFGVEIELASKIGPSSLIGSNWTAFKPLYCGGIEIQIIIEV